MDTFARLPASEREPYIQQVAANMGLQPHIVEKDFWVCWTLKRLFALECVGGDLIFKGGTSLSKVFGLIRRFSEDIDLSIHRASLGFLGDSDPVNLKGKPFKRADAALVAAVKTKIQGEVRNELTDSMRRFLGDDGWNLLPDESDPDGQSLSFIYPATNLTPGASAYLRPAVKIEFGARSDHEPSERRTVRPYLEESIPGTLDEPETEVKVIGAVRTFWEKATILHQMAHLPEGKPFPTRYSRHYCDLAAMIEGGLATAAGADEELLSMVVAHKMAFYRSAWSSYETARRGTLKLAPPKVRHDEIASDLDRMSEMFFDGPPTFDHVLAVLTEWETKFNRRS